MIKTELFEAGKMVQEVKVTKPSDLNSIPGIYTEVEENRLQKVLPLTSTCTSCQIHTCINIYTHIYMHKHTNTDSHTNNKV